MKKFKDKFILSYLIEIAITGFSLKLTNNKGQSIYSGFHVFNCATKTEVILKCDVIFRNLK